ncbi:MFS transporter [Kibdelosporangium persicum]|uniref:Arabinose efflux permease, MFS family n=1 Tax=Kibdelosporangium persicum TaxID=2698649 RepID=A0ABX2FHV1_9PSEU|nr:MFS transporter [Kibdelosporangium persicum]NRN70989.1 putative arabinose efflux permease, MFS family [Kibdelosporangium persicum]
MILAEGTARRPGWTTVAWWSRPIGTLYLASLVLSVGKGAWFTCWAIFFVRSLGLTTAQFGIGITTAGLIGMIAGGPLGYVADRLGAREMLVALGLVQGIAVLSFLFVRDFWPIVIVTCVMLAAERAIPGIRTAVITGMVSRAERLASVSTTRVMTQAGIVAGAGFGAIVLAVDSRIGYLSMILFYGISNIVFVVLLRRVPHVESLRDRKVKRRVLVLRDRPFLVLTAFNGMLALCFGMLSSGTPLWIASHTQAPTWVMGVLVGFNSVMIVLFQNRVTRRGETVHGAGRLGLWSGILLAVACLAFAATYNGSGTTVLVVLLIAATIHVAGELLFMGSGLGLSVGLTPDGAHGEYQGVFNTGQAAALMLAPGVMAGLLVELGATGWFVLGAVFLVAGVGTVLTGNWALRRQASRAAAVEE